MFSKGNKAASHHFDTLISSKCEIVGDLHFSGGLHIDGKVHGNVVATDDAKAVVRVSDKGTVEGEISAPHVVINGTVNGDIYSSEHIELAAKAAVTGNVYYNMIEMVMGSQVNGKLLHQYRGKGDKGEKVPALPKNRTREKPVKALQDKTAEQVAEKAVDTQAQAALSKEGKAS